MAEQITDAEVVSEKKPNTVIGVPNTLFNEVFNYLTGRPFAEVRTLITSLETQCQLINVTEPGS